MTGRLVHELGCSEPCTCGALDRSIASPQRIQLRRTKGWRKPEGAIVVARPSPWGNWFAVRRMSDLRPNPNYQLVDRTAIIVARLDKRGTWTGGAFGGFTDQIEAAAFAVDLYRRSLEATFLDVDGPLNRDFYLRDLRGHDLACWCAIGAPCHADVLLDLANR